MEKNDISSFFYYMWNCWSEEECAEAFKDATCGWQHIWSKYCLYYDQAGGADGAISKFYANLDDTNQDMLVERALSMYNGRKRIK